MSFMDSVSNAFESLNHAPIDNTQRFMDNHGEGVVKTFMIAALLYATAGQAAWAEGGAAGGEAAAGATGGDAVAETGLVTAGEGEAGGSLATNVADTGIAQTPGEALAPSEAAAEPLGQASTDAMAQTGLSTPSTGTENVAETGLLNPDGTTVAGNTTTSDGLIDKIMGWGKDNKLAAYAGMQVLGGIGNNLTQNQLMDKKTASEKELLAKKYEEERKMAEFRRQQIQSGSYFSGNLPFSATQAKPLRRPDGSLVYGNGLVANAMGVPS